MKIVMTATSTKATAIQNFDNNQRLVGYIDACCKITAQRVDGVWKGKGESSFIFHGVKPAQLQVFINAAKFYQQDAILVISDDNRAQLIDFEHKTAIDLGDWQTVPEEIAIQFDGYTYDYVNQEYWVAATHADIASKQRRLLATQAAVIAANEYSARLAAVGGV